MLKTAYCAILLLLLSLAAGAQELPQAAHEFVQQILSRSGSPSAVSVSFQNLSTLPPETQEAAQNAIFSAFRNANVRLVKPEQSVAEVQITFSEDWQGGVWIASLQQGSSSQVIIRKIPRPQRAASRAPLLTLRKIPVWQQEAPILDFFQDNQNLLVLEPGQLSFYASESGQWRPRQTLAIPHQNPWPRDLRGRLEVHNGHIDAFLPGTHCAGSLSPPSLDCRASDDPWPMEGDGGLAFFSPRRNFFSGLLAGQSAGASVPPFFSAAAWQNGDQRFWLFTGIDGRARLFQNDLSSSPVAVYNGWGVTLAAVHSICGSGWQLLVSAPSDMIYLDFVQAVEITGREALTVSPQMELSGPVKALWPSGNFSQVVNGVVESLATGKYEAFTLTVICNQ